MTTTEQDPPPLPAENRLAPFNPTSIEVQRNIIQTMNLSSNDVLFDLGCGDGRFLISAAERVPGLRCVGIEYDEKFVTRAIESIMDHDNDLKKRVEIRHGDLLTLQPTTCSSSTKQNSHPDSSIDMKNKSGTLCRDISLMDATCIYLYLLPKGIEKVKALLDEIVSRKKHLKNGSLKVATYMFSIRGWEPTSVDRSSKSSSPLYLYHFFPPNTTNDVVGSEEEDIQGR